MLLRDCLAEEPTPALYFLGEALKIQDAEELDRAALVEQETAALLKPDVMAARLSILTDRQMELLERACQGPVDLAPDEWEDGRSVCGSRYTFLVQAEDTPLPDPESLPPEKADMLDLMKAVKKVASHRMIAAEEAAALYKTVNTPEFQVRRRTAVCFVRCQWICRVLYGSAPVSVLCRLMERELGRPVSEEELLSVYHALPADDVHCDYDSASGRMYARSLRGERRREIPEKQNGYNFYIPTRPEMEALQETEGLLETPSYLYYREFLCRYCGIDREESIGAAADLWCNIAEGKPHEDCVRNMIEWSLADSSCAKLILTLYRNCYNHTRLPVLCGHTPMEIEAAYPDARSPRFVNTSFDMAFDDAEKPVRIGRNDPCPCGSGKKYKKCCML